MRQINVMCEQFWLGEPNESNADRDRNKLWKRMAHIEDVDAKSKLKELNGYTQLADKSATIFHKHL